MLPQCNDNDATLEIPLLRSTEVEGNLSSAVRFSCLNTKQGNSGTGSADPCTKFAHSAETDTLPVTDFVDLGHEQGIESSFARCHAVPHGISGFSATVPWYVQGRSSPQLLQSQPHSPANPAGSSQYDAKASQSSGDDPATALTPPRLTRKPIAHIVGPVPPTLRAHEYPTLLQHSCTEQLLGTSDACGRSPCKCSPRLISMPSFRDAAPELISPDDRPSPVRPVALASHV
jgi:hypothetical protein